MMTFDVIRYTAVRAPGPNGGRYFVWRLVARVMAKTQESAEAYAQAEYGPDVRVRTTEPINTPV